MPYSSAQQYSRYVALLAEGVDRNAMLAAICKDRAVSPSSRRAWIEIAPAGQ